MKSVSDAPGIVHSVMALTAVTGWSDARGLSDVDRVRMIRFQTQTLFDDYVSDRQYDMRGRFGELLLLLPSLQTISVQLINQLHAAKQCGLITVDSLLQEMLLGGTALHWSSGSDHKSEVTWVAKGELSVFSVFCL